MAKLHNREYYIIGGKKEGQGEKGAFIVYSAIDAFYLPSKRRSDTRKKKEEEEEGKREEKGIAAEWPVKIAGAAAANNQIRPYFPRPQLQYRPRPPLNSKKARLARPVSQKAKKRKKRERGGKTR